MSAALKSAAELVQELDAAPWIERPKGGEPVALVCPLCAALIPPISYHGRTLTDYRARHVAWHGFEREMQLAAQGPQIMVVPDGRAPGHVAAEGSIRRAAHDIAKP